MGKIAFVFPGQGSQYVGMGKELYDNYGIAKEVFDEANQILGRDLTAIIFNGPEEDLKDTRNAQPGILTTSIALYRILQSEGVEPDFVAGHSLGEYSALVAANAISFGEAISLVQERANLMAEADPSGNGAMAAVLGMEREKLNQLLKQVSQVEAANYNCPGQIVVSGAKNGIAELQNLVTAEGAKFIPLAVSGAFHSSFMKEAAVKLRPSLAKIQWQEPKVPVIANITAKPVSKEQLADSLYQQIFSSVLWEDSLLALKESGVETFVEVGPGKVLSGLVKKTIKGSTITNCEDENSLKKALAILKEV
ncbi:MAG TPA: ACP S-malonyltransferase [Bacillota bacterium]|jgi:[acyl-carrier-protein] S-malonyltransferase|nr:ACP S-malonyltransferase [Bacillota bacterium]HOL09868.1 ACP S-malonyltransferase [Bacillota bacterium]HPO97572.1 ACP S-malonyltransferase [Bacillota bacterium]